ncbi:MAG: VWA domain-containing protein [Planctomycetes bacterium]|nr:VWA domain-containing protein [Planctomycetota bacterium]MCC7172310.1 VWA domain-containing protein [Planctomycetota bacterium]
MNGIEFAHREVLLGAWALPLVLALAWFAVRRQRRLRARILAAPMAARLLPPFSAAAYVTRMALITLALGAFVVAVARPRFGTDVEPVEETGADLVVLLDVSRSMLSEDVFPNRLERAKTYVRDLMLRLRGDRIGVVAFAGRPVLACPLTSDHAFVKLVLEDLDPDFAPRGGTAIGDAIRLGLDLTDDVPERDKAFIVLTDGEDHESFPLEAARLAAQQKVQIFTIGIGDPVGGATIPVGAAGGGKRLEYQGELVRSKLDESLLKDIAVATGGAYVPAGTGTYDLGQIYVDHLAKLRASTLAGEQRVRLKERYQWFVGLGLALYLGALAIRPTRRLALALVLLIAFGAAPAADAGSTDPEVVDGGVAAIHREGLDELAAGRFDRAAELFREARLLAPGVPRLQLAAGFAARGTGDLDAAESAFRAAAGGADAAATRLAFQCLADLEVQRAKEKIGPDPEVLEGDARSEVEAAIERAAAHARSALRVDRDSADARHDLELLRLWLARMKEAWARRDAAKAQEEAARKDVVQLFAELIAQQLAVREVVEPLVDAAATPQRADAARGAATTQRESLATLDLVRAKFDEAKRQAEAEPASDERDHALENANANLAGVAALVAAVEASANALDADEVGPAHAQGLALLTQLHGVLFSIATFEPTLKHLVERQDGVVERARAATAAGVADAVRASANADQRIVGFGAGLLPIKADQYVELLVQLEQEQAATPPAAAGANAPPDPRAQLIERLRSLRPALDKAKENAPKIPPFAQSVVASLDARTDADALRDAEEIQRLLREITDALPKPPDDEKKPPQQDGENGENDSKDDASDDANSESKQDDDAASESKDAKDAKDDKGKPEPQPEEDGAEQDAKQDDEAKAAQEAQDAKDSGKLTDRAFKELMQRALAREKAYKDKKEKLKRALAVPAKVEKDW